MIGLEISSVEPASSLARLGVLAGDRIAAIDGLVPRDVIDLELELRSARAVTIDRSGGDSRETRRIEMTPGSDLAELDPGALTLVDPLPGGIRECNNHCEFCFIRGLPKGLRSSLYVFDDDYRYSFLWGNFLTLSNLDEADWARVGYQRLSPLNVSVHATDPAVRAQLLNHRQLPPILPRLERLGRMGIQVHTQAVLCAGLNDGDVLDQTIRELSGRYPTVQSLSVVPVGLTRYSRVKNTRRPTPVEARHGLELCERWQTTLRRQLGVGFVYGSDELYLLAGRSELPPTHEYDGFPVLSNGVGLLRSMLDDWNSLLERSRSPLPPPREMVWLTGSLAAPALERMADAWNDRAGWRPRVVVVENAFFGSGVTVSGLLTGQDLVAALQALPAEVEDIVLPRGPFGFDGRQTLDGISVEDVGAAHTGRVHLASSARELFAVLSRAGSEKGRRKVSAARC
jgi:putative radical SAM enzyme (TIGR03279 family)